MTSGKPYPLRMPFSGNCQVTAGPSGNGADPAPNPGRLMPTDPLNRVRRAAAKAAQTRQEFEAEVRGAVQERTMRQVAEAAGPSPTRIHQLVHSS